MPRSLKKGPFIDGYLAYLLARASQLISAEFHGVVRRSRLPVLQWRVLATLADIQSADAELLRRRPNARVLIVGGDKVSYGAKPSDDRSWKQIYIDEAPIVFLYETPYPVCWRKNVKGFKTHPYLWLDLRNVTVD